MDRQNQADIAKGLHEKLLVITAILQLRQLWFTVLIFPPRLLFNLTGNRPQSAPACGPLRCLQPYGDWANINRQL